MTLAEWLPRWRLSRAPRLADCIERLGQREDDGLRERLQRIARATRLDDLSVEVQELDALPDDPRIVGAIVGWLHEARWSGSGARPSWLVMLRRLRELGDRRAVRALRAMIAKPPPFLGVGHTRRMLEDLAKTAEALEEACAEPVAEPDEIDELEARLGTEPVWPFEKKSVDPLTLVRPVFERPDDDDVKLVAADALLEIGDPWGEIIQLSFAPAGAETASRLKKLLDKHGATMAGPLGAITKKTSRTFEKGFLVEVVTDATMKPRRDWEEALDAPHWATVRRVRVSHVTAPKWWIGAFAARLRTLRSLREVAVSRYGDPKIVARRTAADAPWSIVEVQPDAQGFVETFALLAQGLGPIEIGEVPLRDELRAQLAR